MPLKVPIPVADSTAMGAALREAIRNRLPARVRRGLRRSRLRLRSLRALPAARAFSSAGTEPAYLAPELLDALARADLPRPHYPHDAEAFRLRGEERAQAILDLPLGTPPARVLELGCADGMTAAAFATRGALAVGADLSRDHFDARAGDAGVRFQRMDARRLGLASGSFDLALSFNAFEHFADPAEVLAELARVVRPGGHVYLSFNPLYESPYGPHAWDAVPVPYFHFLFDRETVEAFVERRGFPPIDDAHVNRWPLARYRELWSRFEDRLERVHYQEGRNLRHLDLIERYPSCFRSKASDFESLLVASIEVLFRRTG